jgi:hypothetical protein
MFQDRTQGLAMGQVHKHGLPWKVLSAAQFAVTQSNTADAPYRHFISQVPVTDETSPAVNSHVNRHYCQSEANNSHINRSGRARRLNFLFLRQTPLTATSVPTCYNSFLSHKLKTLKEKREKESVLVFQQKESPAHFSCNIRHVPNSWFNNR